MEKPNAIYKYNITQYWVNEKFYTGQRAAYEGELNLKWTASNVCTMNQK